MRRPLPAVLALLGLALLALPGCGGDDAAAAALERASTTTSTTSTMPPTTTARVPTFPLTGLPSTNAAVAARPALGVKIDNLDGGARPQAGLNQADVVFEELVEGGITRFLAVFHSTDADPVGPIRSARTSDLSILPSLNRPLLAWSGADPRVAPMVRSAPIVDVGHDAAPDAYGRRGDRRAPHNLFSSTPALWAFAPAGATAPPPMFRFRGRITPPNAGTRPATGVDLGFGGGPGAVPVQFRWDPNAGGWARIQNGSPHVDEAGAVITPQNVIVQFTPYGLFGRSPEVQLNGSGRAWIFTNGQVVEATWSKSSPQAPTEYVDAAGQRVALTPGRTWVELIPNGPAAQGTMVIV
jgi:hypothetical protein